MYAATLTSKGQLVIPKAVREQLALRPGDVLHVSVRGRRIVLEARSAKSMRLDDWLVSQQVKRPDLDLASIVAPVDDYREGSA